ncbi:Coronin-like protein crn1 [Coemansia interrupta]|uniref:Coronin n=1 Tax=Coemansia interrupta TaxID=1126814 RepID=A0A9W8LFS3_9FUNG|nr:Coronin-like protein crn1 [Coemansia interrupta]
MAFIVRSSKYRHVFGTAFKRDVCFENLQVSMSAWDTNFVTANPKYVAVNWNAGGGGAFCVVPHSEAGKLRGNFPLFAAHAGAVLDTSFSPFDDDVIASGAEDHQAMVWRVPEDLLEREEDVTQPVAVLGGHGRKVGHVAWNPVASDVLAVSSSDHTVKLWDVERQTVGVTLQGFKDTVLSVAWSGDGRQLAAASRDKKLRVFDARSGECVQEGASHLGIKGSRVTWLSGSRLATTGFSRSSDRQVYIWNASDLSKPLETHNLDMSAGMLMPFYDPGTQMLYVGGKGDGNIRYYEFADDKLHELSMYTSSEPQRGLGVMPKRGVDVGRCEVMRFYKVASNSLVEPISFKVPRKSEAFQADIYPPAPAGMPAMNAQEFFAGKQAEPLLVDMEKLFRDGPLIVGAAAGGQPVPVISAPSAAAALPAAPAAPVAKAPSPAPAAKPPSPAPVARSASPSPPTPPPASPPAPAAAAAAPAPASSPAQAAAPPVSSAELDALRAENKRLQTELTQATSLASSAQAAAQSATTQLASSRESLEQLQSELGRAQADVQALQNEVSEASAKIDAAQQEARSAGAKVDEAARQVDEYRRKLADAEQSVRGLQEDRERIQGELGRAIEAASQLAMAAEKAADAM